MSFSNPKANQFWAARTEPLKNKLADSGIKNAFLFDRTNRQIPDYNADHYDLAIEDQSRSIIEKHSTIIPDVEDIAKVLKRLEPGKEAASVRRGSVKLKIRRHPFQALQNDEPLRRWSSISSYHATTVLFRILRINQAGNQNNPMPYEVRKVQDCSNLILVSIPKRFTRWMQIEKGSLVKIQYVSDAAGCRVVITKVHMDGDDGSSPQIPN